MTRPVFFCFIGWLIILGPAIACSRDNGTTVSPPSPVGGNRLPVDSSAPEKSYLALGDSYTVATSIPATGSYPVQTVGQLRAAGIAFSAPKIIATNGWTTTNLLDALADEKPVKAYDMVTLLIGVNNQYQGGSIDNYKDQFSELLGKCIAYTGNRPAHVIVLSIPDYSVTPFARGHNQEAISAEIDAFNDANREITLAQGAQYLNITNDSRTAGLSSVMLAGDGLHYTAAEYTIWAKGLVPLFAAAIAH